MPPAHCAPLTQVQYSRIVWSFLMHNGAILRAGRAVPTLRYIRVMALPPSLRFPGTRAFFPLPTLPACRALGLALLTLAALAFCWRGIEMRPHSIDDGMKIDIRVDKSGQVLELLWCRLLRQGVPHTADLALHGF